MQSSYHTFQWMDVRGTFFGQQTSKAIIHNPCKEGPGVGRNWAHKISTKAHWMFHKNDSISSQWFIEIEALRLVQGGLQK